MDTEFASADIRFVKVVAKRFAVMQVAAVDIGPLPEGRQRSRFLAVASFDSSVRVLSLDPADTMKVGSSCRKPCPVHSR